MRLPLRTGQGFTLIEVLVALAIMAIALTALLRTSGFAADNSEVLRQRMLASWAAENRIVMLRVRQEWPIVGQTAGDGLKEDSRHWRWEQNVEQTPNPDFRKVTFRILAPGAQRYVLAELVGFVTRPPNAPMER